jgi:hypothetical protein
MANFPFARFGGNCPRWTLHAAFRTPGRIVTQVVEMPDGARWFTFSRTVPRVGAVGVEDELAIGMGCEIKHAGRLAYARGLDLTAATPIGPACRLCERPDCFQRAAQPLGRSLVVDVYKKTIEPFVFLGS